MDDLNNLNDIELLYNVKLKKIDNVEFTKREVDLLSCIINNRSDKKIAQLLNISPRTVNAHVSNLFKKISGNSKDAIIDFVEKNKSLYFLRNHYQFVLARFEFDKTLKNISKNFAGSTVNVNKESIEKIPSEFFNKIKKDLSQVNVIIIENNEEPETDLQSGIEKIRYTNYYYDILLFLQRNYNVSEDYLNNFYDTLAHIRNLDPNAVAMKTSRKRKMRIYFAILLVIMYFIYLGMKSYNSKRDLSEIKPLPEISAVIDELDKYDFTSNNVASLENAQKNIGNMEKIEQIIKPLDGHFARFTRDSSVTAEQVTRFAYHVYNLACNYCYHHKDSYAKARKLLEQNKSVLEYHINKKVHNRIHFDKLHPEEIISEFEHFKHFSQLYTSTLYMLGRTYIYEEDPSPSYFYFRRAKYLGEKLGLYEGFLSVRNGLALANKISSDQLIDKKKYFLACKKMRDVVQNLEEIQFINKNYQVNYNPHLKDDFINPAADNLNLIECGAKIVDSLALLLEYDKHKDQYPGYLEKINFQLFGDENFSGMLNKLDSKIVNRRKAFSYFVFGRLFLTLHKKNIATDFKEKLNKQFNYNFKTDLEVAHFYTDKAYYLSKMHEYTKKIAAKKLAEIYQYELDDEKTAEERKAWLNRKINFLLAE